VRQRNLATVDARVSQRLQRLALDQGHTEPLLGKRSRQGETRGASSDDGDIAGNSHQSLS
jgi:hypothetical protein